jgi:hypothetical protein
VNDVESTKTAMSGSEARREDPEKSPHVRYAIIANTAAAVLVIVVAAYGRALMWRLYVS